MIPAPAKAVMIRWAVPADAAAIARLSDQLRTTSGDATGTMTADVVVRDGFCAAREFQVLVATDGQTVLGYALFYASYEPSKAARGLYLADLCVDQTARRRGIGRLLLDAVTAEADRQRRSFVWWLSSPDNTAAAAFYAAIPPDIIAPTVARVRLVRAETSETSAA
jgi:ribosomal protein S18 acetylase RimI-like enzyme